jgi:hypothetical protein
LQAQHVAVQLNNPFILDQAERCQLAPAVIEARVVAEVLGRFGKQVWNSLLGDAASVESCMAFLGERLGIESNKRVF